MKITDVRTMLLLGPDPHGVGGIARTWHVRSCGSTPTRASTASASPATSAATGGDPLLREWLIGKDPLNDQPVRAGDAVRRAAAVRPADEPDGHGDGAASGRSAASRWRCATSPARSSARRSTTCSAGRSATGSGSTSTGSGSPIRRTSARGGRSRSGSLPRASRTSSSTLSGSPRNSPATPGTARCARPDPRDL